MKITKPTHLQLGFTLKPLVVVEEGQQFILLILAYKKRDPPSLGLKKKKEDSSPISLDESHHLILRQSSFPNNWCTHVQFGSVRYIIMTAST